MEANLDVKIYDGGFLQQDSTITYEKSTQSHQYETS